MYDWSVDLVGVIGSLFIFAFFRFLFIGLVKVF